MPADVHALGGKGGRDLPFVGADGRTDGHDEYNDKLIIMQASLVQCIGISLLPKRSLVNQLLNGIFLIPITLRFTLLGSIGVGR